MKISSFFYTIGQGLRNLRRNKMFTLASIATIAACLFLFGLFYALMADLQHVVRSAEQGVSVTVFFNEGTTEDEIQQLKVAIEERPEVASVTYVSAEEAWDSFKEEYLGEYSDGFTENPLENDANLEIYLKDVSKQGDLVDYLQGLDQVRTVNRSELTATTLTGFNSLIAYIYIAIVLLLLGVSIFLISNTVTIGISVRQEEINIMKYVGATDYFIRAPFVIEGMIIGFAGSLIPLVLIYFFYGKAVNYITSRFQMLTNLMNFLPVGDIMKSLIPVSILIGVGIGFFGSMFTVHRHLRDEE
ncbi:MAG: permease-like cell division protein FtsX [Lachnospiraceae bacterium]|jgi:cell division transport system permease protein|nr:permease-like cell division protein FtsX [Lachnospiraceae bacterium]MCH4028975.1 permease-like cell division protein FtsX [Lachnospiraceae bacterium]MCH4066830.1 permease-like cell division protein FtsX [Lachnospiraceae bacterium]MCH4112856.1 permease-like cell division protein FtsX [Lachnospiraceae bacterium]MCI1353423.1 permease-like cell division protein FtsX [Lachnospiraceae bacterium]